MVFCAAVAACPADGVPIHQYSWSGLPSSDWASFVAQERLPQRWDGGPQHHSTPDANLAWLLAVMGSSDSSSEAGSSSSNAGNSSSEAAGSRSATAAAPVHPSQFPVVEFMPSGAWAEPRPGFVYKHGALGMGYYRDVPPTETTAAAAVAAAPVPSQPVELDLSSCKELLQQLAALSRGNRCAALWTWLWLAATIIDTCCTQGCWG
jgi:hypothetical protein